MNSEERTKKATGIKAVIFGPYGIGKTSLLKTIDEPTLCLDFEAGLLAVQDWQGDSVSIRTWNEARDIACLIGGSNPALKADSAYSQRHYEMYPVNIRNCCLSYLNIDAFSLIALQ